MRKLLITSILLLTPQMGLANDGQWEWFRKLTGQVEAKQAIAPSDQEACVTEILKAESKYGIPGNLLLAIGLQETGTASDNGKLTVWPWTVNADKRGRWFDSKEEALSWALSQRSRGITSIDLGCMQINQRWHPNAFRSYEEALDPSANVEYAAQLLVRLKSQTGSWNRAAGSYHSFTPKYRNRYFSALKRKIAYTKNNADHFTDIAQQDRTSKKVSSESFRETKPSGSIWSSDLSKNDPLGAGSLYSSR